MADAELLAGRNAIREALLAGRRRVAQVMITERSPDAGPLGEIVRLCHERRITVERRPPRELDRLADGIKHQGVVAVASVYPYVELSDMFALASQRQEMPFLLALDSVQDPQNVGTLVRTAEAVGIHGIILTSRRAVQVTPAVSRASAGAVEHLMVARVTNLARSLDYLKQEGVWIVGLEGQDQAREYREVDLNMPLALVLGSEGSGLRPLVARQCDWLLQIPMRGRINSLNVAVAGSVVLYRAMHAREGA